MRRLVNLLRRISSLAYNSYAVIHAQFPGFVAYGGLLPILFSVFFAWIGFNLGNQILAVVCVLISFYLGTHPVVVAASAAAGAVSNPKHAIIGAKDMTVKAYKGVRSYLICLAVWFFIIGTVGVSRNWGSVITILAAIIMVATVNIKRGLTGERALKMLAKYCYLILFIHVITIISPVFYNKTLGFDPVVYFRTSSVDEHIVAVEEIARNAKDKYDKDILAGVSNRINPQTGNRIFDINQIMAERAQVDVNMQIAEKVKENHNSNSLSSLYKRTQNSFRNPRGVEGAEDNPLIRIIKHSDKAWEVEFLTNEMTPVLHRWPAGTTIVFAGYEEKEVIRNDPAGGDKPFYLPVGVPLGRTTDTSFIAKYKVGGKIILNFS